MPKMLEDSLFTQTLQWAASLKQGTRFIVGLDIDGVLNHLQLHYKLMEAARPQRDRNTMLMERLCSRSIHYLNVICQTLGAEVLLTSTWRKRFTYHEVGEMISRLGGNINFIGQTVSYLHRSYDKGPKRSRILRGLEIEDWIEKNVPKEELPDLQLLIIDDDSDFGRLLPWHLKTSMYSAGLQERHVAEALDIALMKPNAGLLLQTPNPLWNS